MVAESYPHFFTGIDDNDDEEDDDDDDNVSTGERITTNAEFPSHFHCATCQSPVYFFSIKIKY